MTTNAIFLIIFFSAIALVFGGTLIFTVIKVLAWRRDPQTFEENLRREAAQQAERRQLLNKAEAERSRLGRASAAGMFFGFLMLAFGFVVLFFAVRGGYDLARAQTWEAADCTVTEISAERHSSTKNATTYYPKILYEYKVAGVEYTGNRFDAVNSYYEANEIDDALKPYRRGAKFTCFVNPREPQESIASRNVLQFPIFRYSFGILICFGFAVLLLASSLPRLRREKTL